MARKFWIVVFALGTVGGYGAGFASLRCHRNEARERFEDHVATVCVDAARRHEHGLFNRDRLPFERDHGPEPR